MTISSERAERAKAPGQAKDEAPLLSTEGREFLAGKVDADKYLDRVRAHAAEEAERDLSRAIDRGRGLRRRIALIGLSIATGSYAALGLGTLLFSHDNIGIAIVSCFTAVTWLVITANYKKADGRLSRIIDMINYRPTTQDHLRAGRDPFGGPQAGTVDSSALGKGRARRGARRPRR